MEVAGELHDLLATGEGARQAHAEQGGFRARGGELQALGGGYQPLDPVAPGQLVVGAGAQVGAALELLGDDREDLGVVVAGDQRAVAHRIVDQLVAVDVPLLGALGARAIDREGSREAHVVGDARWEDLARRHRPLPRAIELFDELLFDCLDCVLCHGSDRTLPFSSVLRRAGVWSEPRNRRRDPDYGRLPGGCPQPDAAAALHYDTGELDDDVTHEEDRDRWA